MNGPNSSVPPRTRSVPVRDSPRVCFTALVAANGTVPLITPTTAETPLAGDVSAVQNALLPRFQPNAQWASHLGIINTLRQFETISGAPKSPSLQDNPPHLLGRPMNELSNLTGTLNLVATKSNYPIVDGRGLVIVDRIGSTLELVPHLFGANRRPTGQRGALLQFRTGSVW